MGQHRLAHATVVGSGPPASVTLPARPFKERAQGHTFDVKVPRVTTSGTTTVF